MVSKTDESAQLGCAVRRYERRRYYRHSWAMAAGKTWCKRCLLTLTPAVDVEGMCSAAVSAGGQLDFDAGRR